MKTFELIKWRLTGYRRLSKLLHAQYGGYNALTPIGLGEMKLLQLQEAKLFPVGRDKHWAEFIFKI